MKFDYYYGSQADQFSFIRIPKAMLTEKTFSSDEFEIVASKVENGKISAKDKESKVKNSVHTTRSANRGTSRSV